MAATPALLPTTHITQRACGRYGSPLPRSPSLLALGLLLLLFTSHPQRASSALLKASRLEARPWISLHPLGSAAVRSAPRRALPRLASPLLATAPFMFPLSNYRQREAPALRPPRTVHLLRSTSALPLHKGALEGAYSNDHYYDPPGDALAGFCSLCRCLFCPAWCAVRDCVGVVACAGREIGNAIWAR